MPVKLWQKTVQHRHLLTLWLAWVLHRGKKTGIQIICDAFLHHCGAVCCAASNMLCTFYVTFHDVLCISLLAAF